MEEKEAQTKEYEMTYLASPKLNEDEFFELVKEVKNHIAGAGGKLKEELGAKKQKLAYPIKSFKDAYISTLNFALPAEKIIELNQKLKLEEKIIRYLIVVQPVLRALKIKRRVKKEKVVPPSPPQKEVVVEEKKPEKAPPKKEIKIEELDKKLEEILEG